MDPVGPWYPSYNRLAPTTTSAFPAGNNTTTDFIPQQLPLTTTSPLNLQAGHTTSTLASQSTPFNPGGFLSPSSVAYDVFSPLFQPPNNKQFHYASHRQMLPSATTKTNTSESENSRESTFSAAQASFFEPNTTTGSSGLTWNQTNNSFGILPHENTPTASPGTGETKTPTNATSYENNFNPQFNPTTAPINRLNAAQSTDFKGPNFTDTKKPSQIPSSAGSSAASTSLNTALSGSPFFQGIPTTTFGGVNQRSHDNQTVNYQPVITTTSGKDYNFSVTSGNLQATTFSGTTVSDKLGNFGTSPAKQSNGPILQTKAQAKAYPDSNMDKSQSSPISFSMMDARSLNYPTNATSTASTPKLSNNQRTPPAQHQQFSIVNQQQTPGQTSYRHYSSSQNELEYHHPRSKSAASTDSAYSSNTSQNGPDCGVVVPRRSSPLQAHSQASPLSHVPSPAYPMYNSPMASMSSPSSLQHDTTNQCTNSNYKAQQITSATAATVPLDVTVSRTTGVQSQVAYSPVITRALTSNDSNKSFPDNRYERVQEFNQKSCWENIDNNKQRKFPSNYSSDINTQGIGQIQRSGVTYFDTNQAPMQTSCQLQTQSTMQSDTQKDIPDNRPRKIDNVTKKRRSFDKSHSQLGINDITTSAPGPTMNNDYVNRIPPPAHHNVNQPVQNGYFDFERWNLAPTASKMFSTTSGAFSGHQTALHSNSNFSNSPQHHHQGLIMGGHHAASPPTLPYFPPFHLSSAPHSHEFQSSVEMSSLGFDNSNNSQGSNYHQDYREDQPPKVIVPNIEEELGFLQQSEVAHQQANQLMKPNSKDPNSGFMTSYLKFLQGEREPSPPPAIRGGRKATWNRSRPYVAPELNRSCELANGQISNSTKENPSSTIDYANDPRYFPLPKERKKPYIDSSDDGIESEDDFPFTLKKNEKKAINHNNNNHSSNNNNNNNNNNTSATESNSLVKTDMPKPKKGRPIKPGGPTDRKRKAAALAAAQAAADAAAGKPPKEPKKEPLPPRRETSKRKAKEVISSKQLQEHSDGDEQGDSDSDPAWTPAAKLGPGEDDKKKKRGRPVLSKRTKKVFDEDDFTSGDVVMSKRGRKKNDVKNSMSKVSCKIDEKLLASVADEDIDISPFKPGEFVVMKAELNEEYPALWRIDGKTLLQKYEPFASEGRTLYRNISTYSGWTPQNRHIYQQVPVKFWQHSKMETIVEFLRDEMILDDCEYMDRRVKEYERYQDNFEVYIQTLISQALDSNFLTEIFQEQDDYFLSNVKTVDEITDERKRLLLSTTKWEETVVSAISIWPCLNVLKDLPTAEYKGKQCDGCQLDKVFARVLLYGQPYNATTLESSLPDLKVPYEKDFLLCRVCQTKVKLYNKVAHQKYLMFLECARRVADKRLTDQNKDTTIILNELLADEAWLNQLFKDVRCIWAEVDNIEHQVRIKENANKVEANCDETNCNDVPSGTDAKTLIEGLTKDSLMTDSIVSVS